MTDKMTTCIWHAVYIFAWKEGDAVVSTNSTYSFYVTKDRTLTAVFEGAVYNNITWWNLFENGEDIEIYNPTSGFPNTNERLWRLFQVEMLSKVTRADQGADNINGKLQFDVLTFISGDAANSRCLDMIGISDNPQTPLRWMGDYIKWVISQQNKTEPNDLTSWKCNVYNLINRVAIPRDGKGAESYKSYYSKVADFSGNYGLIETWRPWWTNIVCGLPNTMTYNDPMPTEWNTSGCSTGFVAVNTGGSVTPSNWYRWNHVDSKQNGGHTYTHIRAWRKDGVKGPIITRVEEDNLRLYATYVKKHIQEDDPTPNMSGTYPQDATNSDVFRLLFNKTWHPNYEHYLTITRKVQGGMYNTICFPFTVQLGQNGSIPNDNPFKEATFWEYIGTDSKYNESGEPVTILKFEQETAVLNAGVPYLVLSKDDITQEEILFGKVSCDSVPKTVPAREGSPVPITFVGTINPTEVPAGSIILVADNRLAQTTTKGKMLGMRGYFTIDPMWAAEIGEQAADGRVYLSMKKPATTSIPVAPEAEQQTKPEVRKIMRDGQIYILRGDEVYTITGHRVR